MATTPKTARGYTPATTPTVSRLKPMPKLSAWVIRFSLLLSSFGMLSMAIGWSVNITVDNPVLEAVYLCVCLGFCGVGLLVLQLHLNGDVDD